MVWSWRYENRNGEPVSPEGVPQEQFQTQADAETWLGEHWRDLLEKGVDQVTLLEEDMVVYGPMSLHPAE
ncbi:hypothetical protein C3Y87_05455 [Carbonactinospora thermoautotrophica]|uniref:Uncharacterized protein n=1 Tax=Carbonactinospora thermoautotrophica TaxID=1469144 RepID=A0A132NI83_9ACTN|nr:hypothetical protein [Carbonactinospora thermoautotrophica]KWX00565.1 hypothetical protein TH66_15430 [Carbonactinospora thermoautotrophica]KWX01705.1 hypothetical protein LI90_2737 [Carbonactinospora thermoautotrophica]KWX09726.1 hypothetical protein TR74_07860 [Carbonactinospora thermoautotrophica]MCX9190867.1 hypothetical protein [Carbonactinospora thermoautotrophica]